MACSPSNTPISGSILHSSATWVVQVGCALLSLGGPSLLQSVKTLSSVGGGAAGKDVDSVWHLSISLLPSSIGGGLDHSSSCLLVIGLSIETGC